MHFTLPWLEKQNAAVQGSFPIDRDVNAWLIYRRVIGVCYESWFDMVRLLFVGSHKKRGGGGGMIRKLLKKNNTVAAYKAGNHPEILKNACTTVRKNVILPISAF